MKRNLTDNDVIFSDDFSRNYNNKQLNEIQNAYFGHKAFILFTTAWYVKGSNTNFNFKSNIDEDTCLTCPVRKYKKEILHSHAMSGLLISTRIIFEVMKKIHFWSDECSSQYMLQHVFRSFSYFPRDFELTWNYDEAHHFKGPIMVLEVPPREMFVLMLLQRK